MLCHKTPLCLKTLVILHKIIPYICLLYIMHIPEIFLATLTRSKHPQVWCMVLGLFMALTVVMQDRSCESLVWMAENFNIDHLWFFPVCWPESLFPRQKISLWLAGWIDHVYWLYVQQMGISIWTWASPVGRMRLACLLHHNQPDCLLQHSKD